MVARNTFCILYNFSDEDYKAFLYLYFGYTVITCAYSLAVIFCKFCLCIGQELSPVFGSENCLKTYVRICFQHAAVWAGPSFETLDSVNSASAQSSASLQDVVQDLHHRPQHLLWPADHQLQPLHQTQAQEPAGEDASLGVRIAMTSSSGEASWQPDVLDQTGPYWLGGLLPVRKR